tara:strand:+ start:27 stop:431 length:405 start_codon:yes stop_codon:yes gene_type:complete
MDAIKQYMKPKWWLIVVGTIFTILGLMTYIDGEGAAETGWGDDYTDNDVFYEKAWASNVLWVAIIALASGLLIEGRALSIVAMAISAGFIISFILQNLANGDLGYGYLELSNAAPGMVAAVGLFLSGYLHLEDE